VYMLRKTFEFQASHQLHGHDGRCAQLHGHTYKLTIEVSSKTLTTKGAKQGMALDFGDIKATVQPFIDEHLEHKHLNDSVPVSTPTTENLCAWVFKSLSKAFPNLTAVIMSETESSQCEYRPHPKP
jgi:6-pyruvoyltetrahydropterin/6-carboxytetrahydropterin synthase